MFPWMLVHSGEQAAGYVAFGKAAASLLYGGAGAAFGGCFEHDGIVQRLL
jgi:hypothetical protein